MLFLSGFFLLLSSGPVEFMVFTRVGGLAFNLESQKYREKRAAVEPIHCRCKLEEEEDMAESVHIPYDWSCREVS